MISKERKEQAFLRQRLNDQRRTEREVKLETPGARRSELTFSTIEPENRLTYHYHHHQTPRKEYNTFEINISQSEARLNDLQHKLQSPSLL